MGWGATAVEKRTITANGITRYAVGAHMPSFARTVTDCNSYLRSMCVGEWDYEKDENSQYIPVPKQIVARMWKEVVAKNTTSTVFHFMFDSASKMHPCREKHSQQKNKPPVKQRELAPDEVRIDGKIYKPNTQPITKEQFVQLTDTHLPTRIDKNGLEIPVTYTQIFNSPAGKIKIFKIMCRLLCETITSYALPNYKYCVYLPDSFKADLFTVPESYASEVLVTGFGEADNKISEYIRSYANPRYPDTLEDYQTCRVEYPLIPFKTVVHTGDWDIAIQITALFGPHVSVVFPKKVYYIKTTDKFTYTRPKSGPVKVYTERFKCKNPSITTAYLMMCCRGVDYCKGLQTFGFRTDDIIPYIKGDITIPDIVKIYGNAPRTISLDVNMLLTILRGVGIKSARTKSPLIFEEEIQDILFCVAYFCGFDSPIGGPRMDKVVGMFSHAKCVKDLIEPNEDGAHISYERLVYTEQHY